MNFYQILLAQKVNGVNRNLTWYDNLFARFYNSAFVKLIAKFLKIKGNTLVWNQLVQNGNFVDTSGWSGNRGTLSASNNELSFAITELNGSDGTTLRSSEIGFIVGHKYYAKGSINVPHNVTCRISFGGSTDRFDFSNTSANTFRFFSGIITSSIANTKWLYIQLVNTSGSGYSVGDVFKVKNVNMFDLTAMGLDNLSLAEVEQWFSNYYPLPYYSYTTGKLLPFVGTELKTTGKNLINADESYTFSTTITPISVYLEANKTYTVSYEVNVAGLSLDTQFRTADNSRSIVHQPLDTVIGQRMSATLTPTEPVYGMRFYVNGLITVSNIQIEFGSFASSYESYTSSTINLHILEHFPTGMKSARTVYDELTENKAYTRVGSVDLGSLEWNYVTGVTNPFFNAEISDMVSPAAIVNLSCSKYSIYTGTTITGNSTASGYLPNNSLGRYSNASRICVKDSNYVDKTTFVNSLSGVYLYYELATPTESTIDPPLDLSYPIEWGGTEQLLPENTSVPTTSPILADMHYPDGDRADQEFVYREIEKTLNRNNRALSIMLGRNVWADEPDEPLTILLKGE